MIKKLRGLPWVSIIADAGAGGAFVTCIILYSFATVNGLKTGTYGVMIYTNRVFYEHYPEFILFIVGFICFLWCIKTGKRLKWVGKKLKI